ncbi:MAG: heparinase II/III family protein [Tannerella sp.]|jgi:hypothetical protein|nr:heparinase II/III family protein [Tannerella sp.]
MKKILIVVLLVPAMLWGQNPEKREGAAVGAKPCKYDALPHPCVAVGGERLDFIREDILHGKSERKAIYETYVKADADRWLQRSIVIPEMGGWFHDFFCTDGTMLEIPDDRIFRDDVPSRCPVCGKTYLNDKVLAVRRALIHYWMCGAVRHLGMVYAVEGKREYAEKGIEILSRYADAYPRQTLLRQTLEEAVVMIPLAEGYDLLYNAMTDSQRTHIEQDLLWPAAQMLANSGLGGNWGSWHLSAVGVVGYATRHQRFIDYATRQFKTQIRDQLGDDGLWPESVHTYHFYPLNAFLSFVEAAANHGDDLYNWEIKDGKGIRKMLATPLRYAYPDMRLAAINDGWYDSWLPQDQYTAGYYRYRLPEFAWAARQIRKGGKSGVPGDLLDPHYRNVLYGEELPAKLTAPVFSSVNFPTLGIAVLRQNSNLPADREMMMTFDYGPYLGHGHPDKMGVTLFAGGKIAAPDYGTTGYASASNQFLKSTPSHNTLVIDGKNQPPAKDRNLTAFEIHPSFKFASATTSEIEGCEWTRSVMLTDGYAVVWDHVAGNEKHRYDWFFHAEGKAVAVNSATAVSSGEFAYPFITDVKKQNPADASGKAHWDGCGLNLWFMHDGKEQAVFTAAMPTGEGDKKVPLLVLRQELNEADFVALIKPAQGKKGQPDVRIRQETDGKIHITVSSGKIAEQLTLEKKKIIYEKKGKQPVVISF